MGWRFGALLDCCTTDWDRLRVFYTWIIFLSSSSLIEFWVSCFFGCMNCSDEDSLNSTGSLELGLSFWQGVSSLILNGEPDLPLVYTTDFDRAFLAFIYSSSLSNRQSFSFSFLELSESKLSESSSSSMLSSSLWRLRGPFSFFKLLL